MPTERLDVEDEDQRQVRLSQLLQRTASNNSRNSPAPAPGPSSFDFGVRETHPLEPPTHLLARLDEFLPQMEAANTDLARRMQVDPESVDMEQVGEAEEGEYIEMNLGLGVFDVRRWPPSGDAGTTTAHSPDDDAADSGSVLDGSESESESESESGRDASPSVIGGIHLSPSAPTQRPIRPLPKRARPPRTNIVTSP